MLRYAVTPGLLRHGGPPADGLKLIERCRKLAEDGVEFLLLREKALDVDELLGLTLQVVEAVAGTRTRIIVPLAPELAFSAGADGVHLPIADLSSRFGAIKDKFPKAWISTSCHSREEVLTVRHLGLDAILFAPVFGKTVHGLEVLKGTGLESLHEACKAAAPAQVFALGGITAANAERCVRAGASGVAGIRMFFPEPRAEL